MTYEEFEKALSPARLNRYLGACGGDKLKTLELYRQNIVLSQEFYAILSLFEIALRNAINGHYTTQFNDKEWLKNQCAGSGFLNNPVFATAQYKSRKKVDEAIRNLGAGYTYDRLVATISFGFWINLFAPIQFRIAGQTLHKIFIKRPKGISAKDLYNDLILILEFRNRIAHYEQICFNSNHQKDLAYAQQHYDLIVEKTGWLGFPAKNFFDGLDNIQCIFRIPPESFYLQVLLYPFEKQFYLPPLLI